MLGGGDPELALDWEGGDPVERSTRRVVGMRMVELIARRVAKEIRKEMVEAFSK